MQTRMAPRKEYPEKMLAAFREGTLDRLDALRVGSEYRTEVLRRLVEEALDRAEELKTNSESEA